MIKFYPIIKWKNVHRLYEQIEPFLKTSLPVLDKIDSKSSLVMSPHIDDDTIGCGGTMRKLHEGKASITCVYFSDCTQQRVEEGLKAGKILGVNKQIFLDYKSKKIINNKEIFKKILEIIDDTNPDTIFIPSFFERHDDHQVVNYILVKTLNDINIRPTIFLYEVWTPIIPNFIIDISNYIDIKMDAINQYKSQLKTHNWIEGVIGLNRYRGVISRARTHAEAFLVFTSAKYKEIYKKGFLAR